VALVVFGIACAGTKSSIVAEDCSYPVSMSSLVYGPDGQPLHREQLEEVGQFRFAYRSVHMFFTLIPLSRNRFDLSAEMDAQIEQAGGEAIVELSVLGHGNPWIELAPVIGFGLLPAYSDVSVTGVIVRRPIEAPARGEGGTARPASAGVSVGSGQAPVAPRKGRTRPDE
jgi:hypothetical protein